MRKFGFIILTCLFVFSGMYSVHAEKIDYAKYGQIAITIVRADFPDEPVTDYDYLGREKLTEADVQDSFKFTVKENGKPLIVIVKVRHSIQNNRLVSLTVGEQKQ